MCRCGAASGRCRASSAGSGQQFVSMHAAVYNTFNVCRHLTSARTYRLLRTEAFAAWREAAGAFEA